MAKKEGRGTTKNIFFPDQEMEFTVLRALMGGYHDGAAIGEVLNVVRNTRKGDVPSFAREWRKAGAACAQRADQAFREGDRIRAREFYFRAANYYKSSLVSLNQHDPDHRESWRLSKDCFEKAGALMEFPMEKIAVEYRGENLPCYFVPAAGEGRRPVLVIVTGGEGCNMESWNWAGAYAWKNGYSVLLYEGPGNISTIYESGLLMTAASEEPIGKALDALCARADVDTSRIAMLGISFGGYMAIRAAAHDSRIHALIPDSPLRDIGRMLSSVFPKFVFSVPDPVFAFIKNQLLPYSDRATFDLILWEGGVKTIREGVEFLRDFTVAGFEKNISCPVLGLAGDGEGADFYAQANEFLANISSTEKSLRIFTNREGAGSHCQADNTLLMNQEIIAWLNKVF